MRFTTKRLGSIVEKWFGPCPDSFYCPKHNPSPPPPTPPTACKTPKPHQRKVEKKCIFYKALCARNHGAKCDCHICKACRSDDGFQCHLQDLHGKNCKCSLCYEPHDYGCQCPTCYAAMNGGGLYATLLEERKNQMRAERGVREDDAYEKKMKNFYQVVKQLGEKYYCVFYHPKGCDCIDCKYCWAEVAKDELIAKIVAKRHREFLDVVKKMEDEHGHNCNCIKCRATRQRVEMTMCHLHLETCRCKNEQGRACRCETCAHCIRLRRNAVIPKCEDYW